MNENCIRNNLITAIYETIENPNAWQQVVQRLCDETQTQKGILTLRKFTNSEFIVPERYANSPLYYNFSDEEVFTFVTKYIDHDPWTAIEQRNRSSSPTVKTPYILSDYIALEELQKSILWEWLKPQKINDTVVLEIGKTEKYWAAINLYFDQSTYTERKQLLSTLRRYKPHLIHAFNLGEEFHSLLHKVDQSSSTIEHLNVPAAIIRTDFEIIYHNSKFDDLECCVIKRRKAKQLLEFKNKNFMEHITIELSKLQENSLSETFYKANIIGESNDIRLTLNAIGQRQSILGKSIQTVLIMIHPLVPEQNISSENLAKAFKLTPRQKQLAQFICDGGTISNFGASIEKSKSVGFRHWEALQEKTDAKKPSDICFLAEKYM